MLGYFVGIMMGIGAFTPLDGFMGHDDWEGVCDAFKMPSLGDTFWPIPITLSAEQLAVQQQRLERRAAVRWDEVGHSVLLEKAP